MKLDFSVAVAIGLALSPITALAQPTSPSASQESIIRHDREIRTKIVARRTTKIHAQSYDNSEALKQYEQDKLKGWYKMDRY